MLSKNLIVFLLSIVLVGCIEREGTVKYSDCREVVEVRETDPFMMLKRFTCRYDKTEKGTIMSGTCVSIDYDISGTCKVAYRYFKKQANVCSVEFPILRYDDRCVKNN